MTKRAHTTKSQTYQPKHIPVSRPIGAGLRTPDGRMYARAKSGYLVRVPEVPNGR